MMADAEVIEFAKENKIDLNDLFYITRRERLISKEIYSMDPKSNPNGGRSNRSSAGNTGPTAEIT